MSHDENSEIQWASYVYIQSERPSADNNYHALYTVGFYEPSGKWQPESDHDSAERAAARIHYLNGRYLEGAE